MMMCTSLNPFFVFFPMTNQVFGFAIFVVLHMITGRMIDENTVKTRLNRAPNGRLSQRSSCCDRSRPSKSRFAAITIWTKEDRPAEPLSNLVLLSPYRQIYTDLSSVK